MSHVSRPTVIILAVVVSLVAACSGDGGGPDPDELARGGGAADGEGEGDAGDGDGDEVDGATDEEQPSCQHDRLDDDALVMLTGEDVVTLADRVTASTHACAPVAVVARPDDAWGAALAAPVARAVDGPLLLGAAADDAALTSTLSELDTREVLTIGLAPASGAGDPSDPVETIELTAPHEPDGGDGSDAGDATSEGLERVRSAVRVADHLDTTDFLAVDDTDDHARLAALARVRADVALLPLPVDELPAAAELLPASARVEVLGATDGEAQRIADTLIGAGIDAQPHPDVDDLWPTDAGTIWLVDPGQGAIAAVGAVAAGNRDETVLPIDATDPRSGHDQTTRVREAQGDRHVVLGDMGEDAGWQLETVLYGEALPWGGFRLFEDERMVALYGSVETEVLGALGEQGLDATVDRLRTVAEPYGADGARVLPAFELITTIASASAESTGDYSRRTPIDLLRPWVDRAAEEGLYVMLDLQPGRTDFLTQAQEYEELLLEPHVGLALDPEWRLEPDQVHLRQIGSVEASEVQEVADWLAALTRDNLLPEKLLVLHQFRFSMLPDRDTIEQPPELAMVVHMDGQGPIGTKYETYAAITAGAEDRWLWGWKNFYDEDSPTPTPEQVLELEPLPVFVTYQ